MQASLGGLPSLLALIGGVLVLAEAQPQSFFRGSGGPASLRRVGNAEAVDAQLLEAVLADPILLRAVDPQVLQAVLVSAATAVATAPGQQRSAQQRIPPVPLGIPAQFPELPVFPARLPQGLPGATYRNVFPAFGEGFNRENPRFQLPPEVTNPRLDPFQRHLPSSGPFPQPFPAPYPPTAFPNPAVGTALNPLPETSPSNGTLDMETIMAMMDVMEADDVEDFGRGNVPDPLPASPEEPTDPSTERVSEFPSRQMPRQANLPEPTPAVPGKPITVASQETIVPDEMAKLLQRNPNIAQELARKIQAEPRLAETLGLSAFMTHENQILPQSPPFPAAPPGACSLVSHNGHPCDPGLAYSPATATCEWPDTLIDHGCNPEVVTGFGPCPQDANDPRLTPAQIASWPQPMFPVNLDVVTVQNFDAFLAKKFFVVCVPTIFGKLYPRLICCPDHTFFDPFHIDGCVHDVPPIDPLDPLITRVGTPRPF